LKNFLKTASQSGYGYQGFGADLLRTTAVGGAPAGASKELSGGSADYSRTNIQVEGVDEADIVKNDGKYIYVASVRNVSIVDAYPADNLKILSFIDVNGTAEEIFINQDKLVVFGRQNYDFYWAEESVGIAKSDFMPPYYFSPKSFIRIYDISDRENPNLVKDVVFDGDYYDSRMIGDHVYVIVNQPITYTDDDIILPKIKYDDALVSVAPNEIYYFDFPYYSYRLTTIFSVDIGTLGVDKKSYLTGYTQTIFVSTDNIYLTSQKEISSVDYQWKIIEKVILPAVDFSTAIQIKKTMNGNSTFYEKEAKIQNLFENYFNKLPESEKKNFEQKMADKYKDAEAELQKELQKTNVYKILIDDGNIDYIGKGEVPGRPLNQFSMDEYDGHFRIATTTGNIWDETSRNHIYVLDENLNIVGRVEDLAPGEKIYSVRFIGKRAYMVTFKKVDPLFVIDLSDPINPKVLGKLKIPGYSDYLHPYDESHIIGIGKEAVEASEEEVGSRDLNFAWYQGVKISLFDVSDVEHPKEVSKFNIGDRGTDSQALSDHKAFLFSRDKNLLIIPILLAEIDESKYPNGVEANTYGDYVWQGAYVFELTLDKGFVLKGKISHDTADAMLKSGYYYSSPYSVKRSLYIDSIVYTVSDKMVKANRLDDLREISSVELPYSETSYPWYE